MHRTVGIVLAYLNCHPYILFVVVFILVGGLTSCSSLLIFLQLVVGCCCLLLLRITAYPKTSDGCAPKQKEHATYHQADLLAEMIVCVFLYLKREDATLAILCTDLPINTTIVQWSNSLRFHDNTKCITTNGQTVIYVGTN